jgi:hypothetical protein
MSISLLPARRKCEDINQEEKIMRFMMIVKASEDSEAGKLPGEGLLAAMGKYNEELMKAGMLVDMSGLKPSSQGARVHFSRGGKVSVTDGPFAETKELVGGYWIIQAKSLAEAIEWARRAPMLQGGGVEAEIEIRPFFELEEFAPSETLDRARKLGEELAAQKAERNQK